MNLAAFMFDASPVGGPIAIVGGVAFFLIMVAVAIVAFLLLRKTLKMAFRIAIVGIILLIAIVGCIAAFWLGTSKPARPIRPVPTQTR